jgi:hypothetical protein
MDFVSFFNYYRNGIYNRILNRALMTARRGRLFRFQGRDYPYFLSRYNRTALNERAVEVPILQEIIAQHRGREILEVGNVLSHYFPARHTIVDKYESGEGVVNEDICIYASGKSFDLIISISTLEHVGFDETPRRPENCILAVTNIRRLLAPGGQAWITIPAGYNPFIDECLRKGTIAFDASYGMKRISRWNDWVQCSVDEALRCTYGYPHAPSATGIIIAVLRK